MDEHSVIFIDADEDDHDMFKQALSELALLHPVVVFSNGQTALDYLTPHFGRRHMNDPSSQLGAIKVHWRFTVATAEDKLKRWYEQVNPDNKLETCTS